MSQKFISSLCSSIRVALFLYLFFSFFCCLYLGRWIIHRIIMPNTLNAHVRHLCYSAKQAAHGWCSAIYQFSHFNSILSSVGSVVGIVSSFLFLLCRLSFLVESLTSSIAHINHFGVRSLRSEQRITSSDAYHTTIDEWIEFGLCQLRLETRLRRIIIDWCACVCASFGFVYLTGQRAVRPSNKNLFSPQFNTISIFGRKCN